MAAGDATWNPKKGVAYRVTFPILDADGDLVTGATGLDPEVSKDGGTFTNATNSVTEIATSSGVYYLDLTATEMNADTVAVIVKTSSSGAKTTVLVFYPLETTDTPVDVLAISGDTVAADNLEAAADGTGYNLGGGSIVAASVTAAVTANTTQLAGQTVTAAAGVTFPSSVASPTNITSASGIVLAATTHTGALIPWNAAWDAEVQSEVQDAIEVNHLDHLLAATYDPASKPGVADSLFNDLVQDNGAGVSQFTTIALELAPAGGGGGTTDWTANERTAIRSILGIPTSGTTPTDPTAGILDTIRDNTVAIEADTVDIQGRLPAALVSGRMDASVGAMAANVLTASALATDASAEVADAVWDEAYAGHTTAGTFGKLMDILRKANFVTEGSVAAGGTPTTTSFRTNLTAANDTYDNQTLLFISGALAGESVPILTYAQTNGLITTQNDMTVAPTAGDEFVILPDHVHSVAEIATATLTSAMTESYRSAGVAPTLAQAAFELLAHMGDSAISGTTKTLKKIDGTTAKTFTLDSSTAPTSITEAT